MSKRPTRSREEEVIERDVFFESIQAVATETKTRKASEIYWVYLKWAALNNREPMNRVSFGRGLKHKYKAVFSKNGHETKYYVNCDLLNLKYEDKVALKEYRKEEKLWVAQELKRKRRLKKLRTTLRRKKQQRREKKLISEDLINNSSPESNKNTTT